MLVKGTEFCKEEEREKGVEGAGEDTLPCRWVSVGSVGRPQNHQNNICFVQAPEAVIHKRGLLSLLLGPHLREKDAVSTQA